MPLSAATIAAICLEWLAFMKFNIRLQFRKVDDALSVAVLAIAADFVLVFSGHTLSPRKSRRCFVTSGEAMQLTAGLRMALVVLLVT